jgi:putative heme-binding domain-containing protein
MRTLAPHWLRSCLAVVLGLGIGGGGARAQLPQDQPDGPALPPAAAAGSFQIAANLQFEQLLSEPTLRQPLFATFDPRGRLWVVQYLQYPEPAGIKALSRDNFWRIVYDRLPKPPGQDVPGADRITIFEQRDGRYVEVGDFVNGLNIATSVVPTADGAWVLNPPHLLFYRDADGDLRADGPPEVHLEGFGLEDTHSVVNSLCFGPDGWLYAAQGSTVTAAVRAYGSSEPPQKSLGQLIWRYHPEQRIYEIFAEGGGNAFGVAFDDAGRVFSGHNGGDTRGFHYVQGGYFRKGFNKHGSLSNPYALGYLMPMQHDPVQRFTHTMLMTDGTALQSAMPGAMLGVDPLHGTLVHTKLIPEGSTFRTEDVEMGVKSSDKWFRPVAISDGPDGAAYVSDWYDSQVAHIYAHVGRVDKDHGRLYRLAPPASDVADVAAWDPQLMHREDADSVAALVGRLEHPYRWQRQQARMLLARHPRKELARTALVQLLESGTPRAIEGLWALYACGWIAGTLPAKSTPAEHAWLEPAPLVAHPDPLVRAWTIRLTCDNRDVSATLLDAMLRQADEEQDPAVLSQLACSARRLPAEKCLAVIGRMCQRPVPHDDLHLPLLMWWAVEQHADDNAAVARWLLGSREHWRHPLFRDALAPRLIERGAMLGSEAALQQVAAVLDAVGQLDGADRAAAAKSAVAGFERAFAGRSLAGVPDAVLAALERLGEPPLGLRLRRGDATAVQQALAVLRDPQANFALRTQVARILGEIPSAGGHVPLLEISCDASAKLELRTAAVAALAAYNDPTIAPRILESWKAFPADLRAAAGAMLASKASGIEAWLDAVEQMQVAAGDLPLEVVRAMRLRDDAQLLARIDKHYPPIGKVDLPAAQARAAELSELILAGQGDPYRGKKLYMESCGRCHSLFDQGGQVGPGLTGYQRDQLTQLLINIVGPSLEIREGYQAMSLLTTDGKLLTGFIERENPQQVILRAIDGQSHTLERDDIESLRPQATSLMPEGLLDGLSPEQLRDLFAYLRSSQPLSDGT